ncbi:MAG: MarR family transcriptional regulator [Rhizobiaceae bacterium]
MRQPTRISTIGEDTRPFVEDYLLYLLAASSHALSAEFHAEVKRRGLKINEWRVLACLVDRPGLMLTELAGLVLFEQSHLTKVIDRMVDQGLVERSKTDDDRRKVLIQITDQGRKIVEPLIVAARHHEKRAVEKLDGAELGLLKHILKKLIEGRNAATVTAENQNAKK